MTYELVSTFQGYKIRKLYGKFWLYVSKVYNGEYTWTTDYTYAKPFALKTAKRHIEKLRRGKL